MKYQALLPQLLYVHLANSDQDYLHHEIKPRVQLWIPVPQRARSAKSAVAEVEN